MASNIKIVGWLVTIDKANVELRWSFPVLEGLREWSVQEMGGRFFSTANGAYYAIPATPASIAQWFATAPLPVVCKDAGMEQFRQPVAEVVPSGGRIDPSLPQPTRRVLDCWGHQVAAYHWLRGAKAGTAKKNLGIGGLAMGMGTGKTKTLIDFAVNTNVHLAMVLCPASVFGAWRHGVRNHAPQSQPPLICDEKMGSVRDKEKAIRKFFDWAHRVGRVEGVPWWVVLNYESARMMVPFLAHLQWDLIALDESHRAKATSGATHKLIRAIRHTARQRVCLTGTPMPHSPLDVYAQMLFLDSTVFGSSVTVFKKRYTVKGFFNEVVGWRNKKELSEKINRMWWFCGDEVLDLPPITITDVPFQLDKIAKRLYRDLWTDFVAEVKPGSLTICDNALVKLLRCQQATCGFLPAVDLESKQQEVEIGVERENVLRSLLSDIDPREVVVVFCRYRYDLARVREAVEDREWELNETENGNEKKKAEMVADGTWQHYRCGEVSGSRKDLTEDARLQPGFAVFAVQVYSGGVGVDFTAAAIAILYSIDYSLGNYDQMLKREHRPGQTRAVRVLRIVCEGTVDEAIYQAITDRRNVNEAILALAAKEVVE